MILRIYTRNSSVIGLLPILYLNDDILDLLKVCDL